MGKKVDDDMRKWLEPRPHYVPYPTDTRHPEGSTRNWRQSKLGLWRWCEQGQCWYGSGGAREMLGALSETHDIVVKIAVAAGCTSVDVRTNGGHLWDRVVFGRDYPNDCTWITIATEVCEFFYSLDKEEKEKEKKRDWCRQISYELERISTDVFGKHELVPGHILSTIKTLRKL